MFRRFISEIFKGGECLKYIGIDPGKKGAFAILDETGVSVYPFSEDAFIDIMKATAETKCGCMLEHVNAMPGQGVTSMFTFGENFGFIQGVLRAYKIPYQLIRPQKWKKEFSVTADKNSSIEVAKRLFPDVNLRRTDKCRKDDDGLAEAILLAEYARRTLV